MKLFFKILKWIGLSIVSLLILIVLAGLTFRLLNSIPQAPGQLINIGGFKLHINSKGVKNKRPTLVIEGGSGVSEQNFHWLSEGLKDYMRVVRYDRAGIGYSDACTTPRDAETVAIELHTLLKRAGETPPYIMAGHSIGGPYIRVFTQMYPDEVKALIFMDATHPERVERLNLPVESSFTINLIVWSYNALGFLADMGILGLYELIWGRLIPGEGLPEKIKNYIFIDGKLARSAVQELRHYHRNLKRSGEANDFGSRPIRAFIGGKPMSKKAERNHKKSDIDLDQRMAEKQQMHQDFAALSTDGKLFYLDGDHNSMYTKKENADIICEEIIKVLEVLERK